MQSRRPPLAVGESAPWFVARTHRREKFHFHTVAGRYIVLAFLGGAGDQRGEWLVHRVREHLALFDDRQFSFFGVSRDPLALHRPEFADAIPGLRFFLDAQGSVSQLYGVAPGQDVRALQTYVLDPSMRVIACMPNTDRTHAIELFRFIKSLPPLAAPGPAASQAPVLTVPAVFEPAFCARLIEYYDRHGGEDMGFARDVNGKTACVIDHTHKRRGDRIIADEELCRACMERLRDRLVPMVERAFQVRPTHIERYLVSCYDADGHLRPHRDNTTKGTAHRQFAVSLFLNTGAYEGGCLQFPEFGMAMYSAPPGGAVVFSCSLLHTAMPVVAGRRLMFLPFLYDEPSARLREENLRDLDESITSTAK